MVSSIGRGAGLALVLAGLSACTKDASIGYLFEQGMKQGALIVRAEPVERLLRDPALDPKTRGLLETSRRVIEFAERELGMKTGRNYRHFLRLDRNWVTKIVVAAPKDRLEPHLFRYPLFGGLPYKGFFNGEDADALGRELEAQGLDVYTRHVEAYSTTGWLPDPIISTMLSSESRLVELLFHELTHANFYFHELADFNEAFASWMGFRGAILFYEAEKKRDPSRAAHFEAMEAELRKSNEFQLKFSALVREIVAKGKAIYADGSTPLDARREAYFGWIRARLAADPVYARVVNRPWNNAFIMGLGTYYTLVPAIEVYAEKQKLDPRAFLRKVLEGGPAIVPTIVGN